MLPSLPGDPIALLTLVCVVVLCFVLLARGNGVQGFKRAAGDAFKNRQRKAERMEVLEAVIEENLADPQYRDQTFALLQAKLAPSGSPEGTSSASAVS